MRSPEREKSVPACDIGRRTTRENEDRMAANEDMIQYWNEVAGAKWVANQVRLDRLMAPLTDALLTAAAPTAGELAVDVGCGCGDVSLRLAALGGGGYIRAVDISRPMLAHAEARRAALTGDLATIQWIAADAMTFPFPPVHSLMVSRFGVMFFDDRPRAFANLRAALAEGGRFAFICWRRRSDCEWMQKPLDWIAPVLPTPEEIPGEIGPFALADDDETITLLTQAGFADVTADKVDCPLVMGEGASDAEAVDDALLMLTDAGPASRLMRDAEPEAREAALDLFRQGLATQAQDGRVLLEGSCWIYSGYAAAPAEVV